MPCCFLQYCFHQGKVGKFTGTHVRDCVWATSLWIFPSLPIRLTFYWDVTGKPCLQSLWNSTHFKHCLKWEQQPGNKTMNDPTEHASSSQHYQKRINDTFPLQPSSISYLTSSNISKIAHEFLLGIVFTGHN